ncbi:MAG: RNA methyltransferase [Ignavibacteriae bacterium]|nr:RNA methyltransferase [Ignavibacteriota bacterium]
MDENNNSQNDRNLIDLSKLATEQRIEKIKRIVSKRQPTLTVVLENVHDAHNVSAVFRSCDAVGVLEVCLVYYGGQEFPDLAEKSSASARKWVGQRKFISVEECYKYLRSEGKSIYTTGMNSKATSLYDLKLTEPVALVFGNEHSGVSFEAIEKADGNFIIPQMGMIQSLNISVACAVSVYEAFRQRDQSGMYKQIQMEENRYKKLVQEWVMK